MRPKTEPKGEKCPRCGGTGVLYEMPNWLLNHGHFREIPCDECGGTGKAK